MCAPVYGLGKSTARIHRPQGMEKCFAEKGRKEDIPIECSKVINHRVKK